MDPRYGTLEITQHYDLLRHIFRLDYAWVGGPFTSISQPFVAAVIGTGNQRIARGDWVINEKVWLGPCGFRLLAANGLIFYAKRVTPLWLLRLRQKRFFLWLWGKDVRL